MGHSIDDIAIGSEKGFPSSSSNDESGDSIIRTPASASLNEVEKNSPPQPQTFPEGGLRAWLTVLGSFLVQYVSFGYINAFGVYQDFYVRQYLTNSTPSDIGWIGGIQVCLNLSLGIVTGKLFDRGYFMHLMIASLVLHAIALFMLSLSHENQYYQVFLTNGLAFGLSSGLSYVPSLSIVGHYFRAKRSVAIGIVSAGSALGAILQPIMLNKLFSNPKIGFHNGVRISASLNVFLLILAILMMRTRLPPKELQTFPVRQWIKQPAYLSILISAIFCFLGLFYPVFYLQLDATVRGLDTNISFYALSIMNAASFFGRIVPSHYSPRLGVFNLAFLSTFCMGVVTLCMVAVKSTAGVVLFAIFFGFFSGGCISLTTGLLAHLATDHNEIGTRMGIFFGIGGILGLVAQPISGALLTTEYHWLRPGLFAGLASIVSSVFYAISRHYVAKQRGKHNV